MRTPGLCTEQEISALVHEFYATVRQDARLGPIFNAHVQDWTRHLGKLVDFWSSILRGTQRLTGTPMPKHMAPPNLSADLFKRWLALFRQTTAAQPNEAMGQQAFDMAQRIAQSLWYLYQLSRDPDVVPGGLGHG